LSLIPRDIFEALSAQNVSVLHDVKDYVDLLISDLEEKSNLDYSSENTFLLQSEFGKRERMAVTYQQEWIYCGKECNKCPHGPYWYAYWKEDGKTRSKYIGKKLVLGEDFDQKTSYKPHEEKIKSKMISRGENKISVTYRQEWVRCGKECSKCPHGPYWYAYWKEGGKTRSKYVGKELKEISFEKKRVSFDV